MQQINAMHFRIRISPDVQGSSQCRASKKPNLDHMAAPVNDKLTNLIWQREIAATLAKLCAQQKAMKPFVKGLLSDTTQQNSSARLGEPSWAGSQADALTS